MQRRLSAILAADVVGYSRLMGADQVATLAALAALKANVLGPVFADQGGRIVKAMGDGWLVEFSSAVAAVTSAMQVQDRLRGHDSLRLRIGVHLGDVIEAEGEVYGEGINIAARLEALAPEGAVLISDAVFSSLDGTLAPSFEAAGPRSLKNIARPVITWVRLSGARHGTVEPAKVNGAFPLLAIAPVTTTDPRPEMQDLAHALTADLSIYLGSVKWLRSVVSAQAMPDSYGLQSSLRSQGDRLRLETRLTAPDGRAVWSRKSDSSLSESFDWQDTVIEHIAGEGADSILEVETLRLAAIPDDDMTAAQCNLMGMMAWRTLSCESFARAAAFQARAIAADPGMADAYAEAILVVATSRTVGSTPGMEPYKEQLPGWVAAAQPLATGHPALTLALGMATFQQDRRIVPFNQTIAQVLRLAPFDGRVLSFAGWSRLWCGDPVGALECFAKAIRLGRLSPFYAASVGGAGTACIQLGRDAEALHHAQEGLTLTEDYITLFSVAAAACALMGDQRAATDHMRRLRAIAPQETVESWKASTDYGGSEGGRRYFSGLILAGLPES